MLKGQTLSRLVPEKVVADIIGYCTPIGCTPYLGTAQRPLPEALTHLFDLRIWRQSQILLTV